MPAHGVEHVVAAGVDGELTDELLPLPRDDALGRNGAVVEDSIEPADFSGDGFARRRRRRRRAAR